MRAASALDSTARAGVPCRYIFFFFSSRRRHTRLQGDWSSDVCSSDLHFLELAAHPAGAAEPCDAAVVINGVLAERDSTFRELGVKLTRSVPPDLPMVACPMAQLTEKIGRAHV